MWNAFHFWFTAARVTNTHHGLLHMSFACLDQVGNCGQGRSTWTSTWFACKQLRLIVTSKISRKWTNMFNGWNHLRRIRAESESLEHLERPAQLAACYPHYPATPWHFTILWQRCAASRLCGGLAFNRMPGACTKESWWDLAAVPAIPFKGTIGKDLLDIKFTLAKHGVKQIL